SRVRIDRIEPLNVCNFFFSSRRRHTSFSRDWSSDVCSSDLRRKFFFLNYAEKFNLKLKRQFAYFIKEQGSTFGSFHKSFFIRNRSEERRVGKDCKAQRNQTD